VIFENVNFGDIGSDTVTLPLFPLNGDVFPIGIWVGIPHSEDGELIDTVYYDLGKVWNTYQEKTYKLSRRFKGLATISFVFDQKVHMKGFSFKAPVKAYEQLSAIEYNFISGDSYAVTDEAVEDIGNNVTLIFDEMDFSSRGISKIQICGSTPLTTNTIQMRFSDGEDESIQVVEFAKSEDYEIQEFELQDVDIDGQISFIFLPGCQFNFKWFRFL